MKKSSKIVREQKPLISTQFPTAITKILFLGMEDWALGYVSPQLRDFLDISYFPNVL